MDYHKLLDQFKSKYQSSPRVFRSPGRINIIGEHTDYNEGFVLPAAVDKEIVMIIGLNNTNKCSIYSYDQNEEVEFTLNNYSTVKEGWAQYIIGVVDQLHKYGSRIGGFDCVFGGDIPIGAGMSSSAALECVTLFGLNQLFTLNLDKLEIALMSQQAENQYVGVNCGIMDQFASVFSEENKVIKLDCRDLSYKMYELDLKGFQLILVDSMVKHSLASSEYNTRREECEKGVSVLSKTYPHVKSLRDANLDQFEKVKEQLPPKVFKRCKYVIEENARVSEATQALEKHDVKRLGELLYETHSGLQHDYEVSCSELDFLVDFTKQYDWVLGARMMGGGFGGCSINLVETSRVEQFILEVEKAYIGKFKHKPTIYKVGTAEGTSEIEP